MSQNIKTKQGKISVQTEDILPIIKKWLYSEHDIFLRELVANATDAITKRAMISRNKNLELPVGNIFIEVNKTKKIISITDNGIGLTEDEVEKYLTQVAFSGAKDFIKKIEEEKLKSNEDVIGKFGLGFYSVFMVADKVELETLSMHEGAIPLKWEYGGSQEYTFKASDRKEVGTKITLHINKDGADFLSEFKVSSTLRQHCDFMPYTIEVLDLEAKPVTPLKEDGKEDTEAEKTPVARTVINNTEPLWKKDPKKCTDEEYKAFYQKFFPMDPPPLFWVHLKIDHPFTLEGILYFPKINPLKPFSESSIRLYCKRIFVSDNVKKIIPDFLSLLKGVIDSSDIPLNISRSSLQGDLNIKKISAYIVKKIAEALKKLFKKDRERYEKYWEDTGLFVKYGSISDAKFDKIMRDKVIFKNTDGKYMTLDEYRESIPQKYTEKMKGKVLHYEKLKSDFSLKNLLHKEGIESFETEDHIDPHYTQHVEMKQLGDHEYHFVTIDAEIKNILDSEVTDKNDIKMKDLFSNILNPGKKEEKDPNTLEIELHKISNATAPAYFKVDEQMKKFQKMSQQMGTQSAAFPIKKTLVINPSNPLVINALKIHEKGTNEALVEKLCYHIQDLAKFSSEGLEHKEKEVFLDRSQTLIEELTNLAL